MPKGNYAEESIKLVPQTSKLLCNAITFTTDTSQSPRHTYQLPKPCPGLLKFGFVSCHGRPHAE